MSTTNMGFAASGNRGNRPERFVDEPEAPVNNEREGFADEESLAMTGPSRTGSSKDPGRSPSQKKQINKDFKDVRETGRWGSISKKEVYVVGTAVVLVVIAVIVVVVVLATKDDGTTPSTMTPTVPVPTAAPTERPVVDPEIQLTMILDALGQNTFTNASLAILPVQVASYQNLASNPTAPPAVRAVSWILFNDPFDNEDFLVWRYALAVLYYTTGGASWANNENWLTATHACSWHGVICDRFDTEVMEIDLSANDLVSVIPPEINLLQNLTSITFRDNRMSGTLPALALGSLPDLRVLDLQTNSFNGTISPDLRANGKLDTLFLQGNSFTGIFPYEFCPAVPGDPPILTYFGIDCSEVACICCDDPYVCF